MNRKLVKVIPFVLIEAPWDRSTTLLTSPADCVHIAKGAHFEIGSKRNFCTIQGLLVI